MQKQRGYVYRMRNELLKDKQIIVRVRETAQQMCNVFTGRLLSTIAITTTGTLVWSD